MSKRATYDACIAVDKYQKDGEDKQKYINIGVVITDDETGKMSLKLSLPPTFKINDKGFPEAWISFFLKNNDNNNQGYNQPPPPNQNAYQPPPPNNQHQGYYQNHVPGNDPNNAYPGNQQPQQYQQ